MKEIVKINNLKKHFGDVKAVDDISFNVREGELFAFLGVNGAGKSTTISIMCGMLQKDGGEVLIDDKEIGSNLGFITKEIGVVFQKGTLDNCLSVKDNLINKAFLYGLSKIEAENKVKQLASLLSFTDILDRTYSKLSGGQQRRIDVARALINDPKLLILDEPTTGLDPQTRKTLWDVISKIRKERQMTVILTTHYMEETADADYVVIIDSGKIVASGTPLDLKNTYTGDYITVYNPDVEKFDELNIEYEKIREAIRICVNNTEEAISLIKTHEHLFKDIEIIKGKMDDVFLKVTGKDLRGE